MLEKKEDSLMRAIFTFTTMKGGVGIIRPIDLLSMIPYSIEFKAEELEPILSVLELDDYIETVETDKKGETFYCITLKKKGQAYKRSIQLEKRNKRASIVFKIILTLLGLAITTIVSKLILPLILK